MKVEIVKQSTAGQIIATPKGKAWMAKTHLEQVSSLATDPLKTLTNATDFASLWSVRNLHLVEKKLRKFTLHEWVEK